MTKIIIRTAEEKVYFEPPREDAEKLISNWVSGMQPLIKRLRGNQRKSAPRSGNSSKAHNKNNLSIR